MPVRSKLPPLLERTIGDYLTEHSLRQNNKKYEFVAFSNVAELKGLGDEFCRHASCLFLREFENGSFVYSIVPSSEVSEIIEDAQILDRDLAFYFYKGGLYLDFGRSEDGLVPELHLSASGLMIEFCDKLCVKLGGVMY
ncbi:MAG: hypothetical protein CFE27_15615 [Alphaproteobacteria bacterium PA1]|nr:MAG: hypothetical protein CFE27_15615 [Alphaproteobacteria bacterium PA1]